MSFWFLLGALTGCASECDFLYPGLVVPAPGTKGVPLNAALLTTQPVELSMEGEIFIAAGDVSIPITTTPVTWIRPAPALRMVPSVLLEADTEYVLWIGETEVTRFTTGDELDDDAPVDDAGATASWVPRGLGGDTSLVLEFEGSTADSAFYEVELAQYAGEVPEFYGADRVLVSPGGVILGSGCGELYYDDGGITQLRSRPYDLVGNSGDWVEADLSAR